MVPGTSRQSGPGSAEQRGLTLPPPAPPVLPTLVLALHFFFIDRKRLPFFPSSAGVYLLSPMHGPFGLTIQKVQAIVTKFCDGAG